MSNKYTPHLYILPEDDANREFANGFVLDERVLERNIQILKPAGGWRKAVDSINKCGLDQYPERRLLLLIDFDGDIADRRTYINSVLNPQVASRVYVLGAATEPERLRLAMSMSFEKIGLEAAQQCAEGKDDLWRHELLKDNVAELTRLSQEVRGIVIRK
ncbi:MAG: hypothetical protein K2X63_04470 [Burkholderiaceae bacterium]|nr:hypothetical protein [Burkholderiaceae bacterium]